MSVDFDARPLIWNLERIAAGIEKIQLRVDVPEINPHVHVAAPVVNVEARPGHMHLTSDAAPTVTFPPATVIVKMPVWPSLILVFAALLQAAVALQLFPH